MDTTALMHRNSRVPKSKLRRYNLNLRNHCSKSRKSLTRRKKQYHDEPHNHCSISQNRQISSKAIVRNFKRIFPAKENGNLNHQIRNNLKDGFRYKMESGISSMDFINDDGEDPEKHELIVGNFTREVYNAICSRLGDTLHIPEDSVKTLFNDMHLFPSDSQVTKMLQCARQYSRRNGTSTNYLTFGEFCFLVREMQNHPSPKAHRKTTPPKINNNMCQKSKCEVFLGGSCNPTTWRADTAIPELQKHGISFYNPQVTMWAPELVAQEHDAKESASVLLFMIDSQTRSTVGMIEVAYLVATRRCVIVVAQPYRKAQSIMGEVITDREYHDLVQGQQSLLDLIKSQGVQIHNSLPTALQCIAEILRNVSLNGISPEEQVISKLRRLREVYDSYNGQMRIPDVIDAYGRLTNRSLEISKLYNYFNLQNSSVANCSTKDASKNSVDPTLSFEKFCAVIAELSTDGCGMCNIEAWASQTFTRNQHTQCPNTRTNSITKDMPISSSKATLYDVYLGGSLSTGTKWRESVAIPLLKQHGLRYYNPALRDHECTNRSTLDEVSRWRNDIDDCNVALFVITNDTRSLTSMILAAHYIGSGKDVVLSIEYLNSDNCVIADETLSKLAVKDYNRVRAYLRDMSERLQVPVFDNVDQAISCVITKLQKSTSNDDRTELNT